ncbi:MAG: hypothetical protein ACXV3D_03130 [Halobacteriota archaeon]
MDEVVPLVSADEVAKTDPHELADKINSYLHLENQLIDNASNQDFLHNYAKHPRDTLETVRKGKSYTKAPTYHKYNPLSDPWMYHTVVKILGAVVLGVILACVAVLAMDKPVPESFIALGSVSVGALAALVVPQAASTPT